MPRVLFIFMYLTSKYIQYSPGWVSLLSWSQRWVFRPTPPWPDPSTELSRSQVLKKHTQPPSAIPSAPSMHAAPWRDIVVQDRSRPRDRAPVANAAPEGQEDKTWDLLESGRTEEQPNAPEETHTGIIPRPRQSLPQQCL